jgi:hypothetical protein
MKRLVGSNSCVAFLLCLITFILADSSILTKAASSVPEATSRDEALTGTKNTRGSAKAPKQLTARTKASLSTASASGAQSHRPTAARSDDCRNEITALRGRLDHQEQLLAAQQRQIATLIAAVDELKGRPNRSLLVADETGPGLHGLTPLRLVSYEPDSAAKGEGLPGISDPHDPTPSAKGGEPHVIGTAAGPGVGELSHLPAFASLRTLKPLDSAGPAATNPVPQTSASPTTQTNQDQTQPYVTRLDTLSRQVEGITKGVAGFRFSGDLRLRSDGIYRSSDKMAGPEQNVRGQYRARLNLDKGIDKQLDVHFQLGSGRFDSPLTDDTDMGGGAVRGPIFLTEAYVNYHPSTTLNFQGGRMPEVLQDYSRFLWDEDVRFNGFQQSVGTSPSDNPLGITRVDVMAGQYILTNPNIQVLPSLKQCTVPSQTITSLPATITTPAALPVACVYLQAGYKPGENVRASDMFDQGVFIKGRIKRGWSHYMYTNMVLFRNPNQIALTSTSAGLPALVNPIVGVALSGPLPGTGSATTISGGGIYTADHYQVGHIAYRITKEGWMLGKEEFPVFLDLHAGRNLGTGFQRNAWMATLNAGQIKKRGDVRFLYLFGYKEANSMISQFTDDRLGSVTGVNIRTHSVRMDMGLASFLQWQNILYIQNELARNDPARHFYVPVQAGTATQFRVESSMFVNF